MIKSNFATDCLTADPGCTIDGNRSVLIDPREYGAFLNAENNNKILEKNKCKICGSDGKYTVWKNNEVIIFCEIHRFDKSVREKFWF